MSKGFLNDVNQGEQVQESFRKETFEKIKPDLTKYYIIGAIVLLALVGSYFLFNQPVTLTDFTGWTLSDAETWADNNGIQLVSVKTYDRTDADTIIAQDIVAGSQVMKNASIILTVSEGPDPQELITLPAFDASWTKAKIVSWLNDNAIDSYTFSTVNDDTVATGTFVRFNLPDATTENYTRSDSIEFTITTNSSSTPVTVVDFTNYTQTQINNWASDNGIKIRYAYAFNKDVMKDKVLDQSVDADEEVTIGDTLTITLSRGEAVTMPYFASYSQDAAKAWAQENGISLSITTAYSSTVAKGVPIYQDIPAKTVVETGSKLNLIYSLGSEIILNSFAGKNLTELEATVDTLNALGANLTLSISTQYDAKTWANKIISMSPADTSVSIGSTIQVVVSKGALVSVPDFFDLIYKDKTGLIYNPVVDTYNAINNLCSSQNLTCRITLNDDPTITDLTGQKITQSLSAGSMASSIDPIEIVLTY